MRSLSILLLLPFQAFAQLSPTLVTTLADGVNETSGMIVLDGTIWMHNDSGGLPMLYQIDPGTGSIVRSVTLDATNVDWEDMALDGEHVLIGDLGNSGDRTDLRIYRFAQERLLDTSITTITVDTITFTYADQLALDPEPLATAWDCEAMIAKDDSIFLFTKDWVEQRTRIYALPAIPGTHQAEFRGEYDVQGLITGASYEPSTDQVILIGYTSGPYVPFICKLSNFTGNAFFTGDVVRQTLSLSFVQTEAVAWRSPGEILISNEQSPLSTARLWSLGSMTGMDVPENDHGMIIHPNPANDRCMIDGSDTNTTLIIYDGNGREVVRRNVAHEIDVSDLSEGVYHMWMKGAGLAVWRKFVVHH